MKTTGLGLSDIIAELTSLIQTELRTLGPEESLACIEERMQNVVDALRAGLLEGIARRLGSGNLGPSVPCACGSELLHRGNRPRRVLTLLGDLHLRRAYYRCPRCSRTRVPLDERLGLEGGGQSRGVVVTTMLVCALLPNAQAMDLLEQLGVPHVSVKESQRIVLDAGQDVLAERQAEAVQWSESHVAPTEHVQRKAPKRLAVLMDGTMAHTDGDWHEAKVGAFYSFDEEGKGTGHKSTVATFEGIDSFRGLWDTEAQRWRLADVPEVVALCDGSAWTWNTIAECCPKHTLEVLDFYHAVEHLWEMARALWGESSPRAKEWVEEQKERLKSGDLDAFFAELDRWVAKEDYAEAAGNQLTYFTNNRKRLCYAEARARGYPIGSGVVESACKTVIGLRLKQPGMRWRKSAAEVIAALRCIYYSGRWNAFRRKFIHAQARAA